MKRAIIIDDEQIGVTGLQTMLERYCQSIRVVGSSTDPRTGVRLIEDYRPDVVFLDITMPLMDGFEMLEQVSSRDFQLVFTTAHPEYAIPAIKARAVYYLLKPIDVEDLQLCAERLFENNTAVERSESKQDRLIELSVKDGVIFIRPADLIRLEASGSYTVFYLDNNVRHVASKNLKECETLLDPQMFFRCHPSHIVNLRKVSKLVSSEGLRALMFDGSMADVTRKNKDLFLEKLKIA